MKISNKILYGLVILIIFTIICAYIFNGYTNICIGVNGNCIDIPVGNLGTIFLTIMGILLSVILGIWRHYILKEKDDEKNNHLKFLRTIQEKEGSFDLLYFDEFEEAEKKFNSYKKGFILPFGYEYNIGDINLFKEDLIESLINGKYSTIDNYTIELLDSLEVSDYSIGGFKKFIDLEEYILKLRNNGFREFNLSNNSIKSLFDNEFFELNNGVIKKEQLLRYLNNDIDYLVLIKGYYILYYKN